MKRNLKKLLSKIKDYWNPVIVGELNNQLVKLAKLKGEFVMHKHDSEDELFLILKGKLNIEYIDKTITLKKNDFVIIPKGVMHKPYCKKECHILLFEPGTTINTGDVINNLTKKELNYL